jgi:hypothetical protein
MLSSSHPKIHDPHVTGVSTRPTDRRQRQKTAKHEGFDAAVNYGPASRPTTRNEAGDPSASGPGRQGAQTTTSGGPPARRGHRITRLVHQPPGSRSAAHRRRREPLG